MKEDSSNLDSQTLAEQKSQNEKEESQTLEDANMIEQLPPGLTEEQKEEVIKIVAASKLASPQKKLKLSAGTFFILLAGSMVGGGIGVVAGTSVTDSLVSSISNNGVITITNPEDINWLSAVAVQSTPSVVSVLAVSPGGDSGGSGIIYNEEGYVVTSAHLFQHSGFNFSDVTSEVRFSNGEVASAKLLNVDLSLDLALLKIEEFPVEYEIVPAVWRDSETVQVGEYVAAIGSPLDLFNSVTKGVISSTDRVIQLSRLTRESGGSSLQIDNSGSDQIITVQVLQTDAAINPGNSGGGLVDSSGKFIGLNAAIAGSEGSRGLGFAIPSNNVVRAVDNMIKKGNNSNGLLGAIATSQPHDVESYISFPTGALIVEIVANGPAEKAGIKTDFVITSYNGEKVTSSSDLVGFLRSTDAQTTVKLSGYYLDNAEEIVAYDVLLGVAPSGY
jgi:putative serine protease PepD